MNNFLHYHDPFQGWFRSLSRPAQWALGVPLVAGCLWASWAETFGASPGGPQKGIWVTLILFVVSIVLNELLRPKPNIEDARPAGLGDFQVPTATEGRVVPLIFGRVRQRGPNVVWFGDLDQEALVEKVKTGLWSSETFIKAFRYHLGIQMAICRGPGAVLKRVWIGDDEVFSGTVSTNTHFDINKPTLFGGDSLGNGGIKATVDFYTGSNTQAVSPYLDDAGRQKITTATTQTAPRYSGTCYVVARELTSAAPSAGNKGAYLGNSTTIKPWSFEVERYPALFAGQVGGENVVGVDANPMNVIYELLTNNEWGFGFSASSIDVGTGSSFQQASVTLKNEGNGFSFLLDSQMSAKDFLLELQRQVDGVVFLKPSTGRWTIKLARDDYNINDVPQLNDSNVEEVRDYTRGAWEDTTNTITVQYDKRDDDYKQSFALAQDMANAMIQGDGTVANAQATSGKLAFPGVKSSALASNIAWRELRGQSYPLARCTLVVNRQMWDVSVGDVVAWTNTHLGFVKLPMRVTNVDYGRLEANKMTLTVVQDVFKFAAASMGTPAGTGWTPPSNVPAAFPVDEQFAVESPRAIVTRDPLYSGDPTPAKIHCAAARQPNMVTFEIRQRNASGTPGGSFAEAGNVVQFMKIGELNSALSAGVSNPTATITIKPEASSQAELEEAFDDATTLEDMGTNLSQLILVGTEYMLVKSAVINGANVNLNTVYRGALDSIQQNHAANTDVYLLFAGSGLTDTSFDPTFNVDIELRGKNGFGTYEGAVTTIGLTMAKRTLRPMPPAAVFYNNVSKTLANSFGTPDLEDQTSGGENGYNFRTDWWRRTLDAADEVEALSGDVNPDGHPDVSGTEYQVRVFVDPDGSNTEIASSPFGWAAGTGTVTVPRLDILDIAAAGTEVRVEIEARHDIGPDADLRGRFDFVHDVVPTSVNTGLFHLGSNIGLGPSSAYSVVSAGVHTVAIGAAMTVANAQYRINGGTWTTIIGTSAATGSLSVSDTIEVRADAGTYAPDPNFVLIDNPSAVRVAYGTL